MTELNQNTIATKVAFKDATPEEQAQRRAAQDKRDHEFLASRGLDRDMLKDYGVLSGAKFEKDMTSKSGKPGKAYCFVIYKKDQKTGKEEKNFYRVHTFAPKMMKLFDKVVDLKQRAKAKKDNGLRASILSGKDANGYRDVAWINLYYGNQQVNINLD